MAKLSMVPSLELKLTLHNEHPTQDSIAEHLHMAILAGSQVTILVVQDVSYGEEEAWPEMWAFSVTDEQAQRIRQQVEADGFSLSCEWAWFHKGTGDFKDLNELGEDEAETLGYDAVLQVEI